MFWLVAAAYAATSVDRSVEAPGDVTVSVSATCGAVRVAGSERATVRVSGTVGDLEGFEVAASSGRIAIEVADPRTRKESCVDLLIEVPATASLELEGMSTSFAVDAVRASVEVETVSGGITISGAPRAIEVETVSGDVRVTGAAQRLELQSVCGRVVADGVGGVVSIETVSGSIEVLGGSALAEAELSTVSGDIALTGALTPSGQLEASTHSGALRVRLPADTDASLSQSTFSGRIRDVFGQGEELVIGAGKGRIELSTFSGDLEVAHR